MSAGSLLGAVRRRAHRLKVMSGPELWERAEAGARRLRDALVDPIPVRPSEQTRGPVLPDSPARTARKVVDALGGDEALTTQVAPLLNGSAPYPGGLAPVRTPQDWSRHPVTGTRYPARPALLLQRSGDLRTAWEPARLQHLVPLALAHAAGLGEAPGQALAAQLASFLAGNPPRRGVHWVDALEVALRTASLVWVDALTHPAPWTSELPGWVAEQVAFVRDYRSRRSSTGNHTLGEAYGLFLAAARFPGAAGGEDALWAARREFFNTFSTLHFADGGYREQAATYHRFILEMALQVAAVSARLGQAITDVEQALLSRSARALALVTGRSGRELPVGDGDDGATLRILPLQPPSAAQVLRASAALTGDARCVAHAQASAAWSELVIGQPGPTGSEGPAPARTVLPDTGLTRFDGAGEAPLLVLFDHGSLGLPPLYGHAHADALSVWIEVGDEPCIVDGGTGAYLGDGGRRSALRGSLGHNALVLEGRDPQAQLGPFQWRAGFSPHAVEHGEDESAPWAQATLRAWGGRAEHRRRVTVHGGRVSLRDEAKGRGRAELRFHLSPHLRCTPAPGRVVLRGRRFVAQLSVHSPSPVEILLDDQAPMSWTAPAYGQPVRCPVLRIRFTLPLAAPVVTELAVQASDPTAEGAPR